MCFATCVVIALLKKTGRPFLILLKKLILDTLVLDLMIKTKFGLHILKPINHFDDCYFCILNITGIDRNNRSKWKYPDLASARRPVPHSDENPIPTFHQLPEIPEDKFCNSDVSDADRVSDSD
ncbi:hypothetical protein QTP88_020211 [Uroleucon formosanum]